DSELVSLEVVENVAPEDGEIDTDILLIKDDVLCEKLSKINLLIAKIEALKDNPTPSSDFVTKSPSTSPNFFLEETDTSYNSLPESETFCFNLEEKSSGNPTSYTDLSLPYYEAFFCDSELDSGDFTMDSFVSKSPIPVEDGDSFLEKFETTPELETFKFDIEEKNSGSTTIHAEYSLPDLEYVYFKSEPDPGDLTSIDPGIRENVSSTTNVNLPVEDDQSPLFVYVVWIFLSFLTYPVAPPYLLSSRNEDTIFDPGISIYHSFMRDCPDFEASRARGFVLRAFHSIKDLTRLDLVDGLPKFKYGKDHLCSACERGKSKKASHPLKLIPSDHSKLELLHMDLCGPMRVASINGKKYILVIVDDYSRYTWVYFLHSKDETPEIIKKFIAQAQLNYKAKVCKIRTDNVVERRNRTLVEAARTMLIFSRLPEFLWAEAVATACFTQNRSIIHTRHNKTPYELLRGRKPNVEYFHVFGSLCYPTNDQDDLGKMKPKVDIGVFIGYSKTLRGFQIYNRHTKKIMETINVKFDELTAMASKHDCLEPELQQFINHNSSAEEMNTPLKEDLDNLFSPMFEEYFEKTFSDTLINSAAQPTQIHEDSPSTSSFIVDENEAAPIVTTSDEQISLIPLIDADEFNQEDSAHFDGNSQFVSYNPPSSEEIKSSTTALEPSNV
ncbi:retrovirus-related pol polyprotein from transposon TNT 1-94, partial [Tanacetum coccineum]